MLKGAILAAALLAAATTVASAETVFRGVYKVTAVTPGCTPFPQVGETGTAQFHPFIAGQSDTAEGLSVYFQFDGIGWTLPNHVWDATLRTAQSGGLGWGGPYIRPANQAAQVRMTSKAPATITATTPRILLVGQIRRPNGNDNGGLNCTLTFEVDAVKAQ